MRPLLIIGGGGILMYYLYKKGYFGSTTATPITSTPGSTTITGSTGGTTTTGTTPTGGTTTTTPLNPNSLSAIFTRMVANAQAPSSGLTPDGWGYSLNSVQSIFTAPDPDLLFPDRTIKMTAEQYWQAITPYISQQYGLSGIRGMGRVLQMPHAIGWA